MSDFHNDDEEVAILPSEEIDLNDDGDVVAGSNVDAPYPTLSGWRDIPTLVETIAAHDKDVMDIFVDTDGQTILSCSNDKSVACFRGGDPSYSPHKHVLASRRTDFPSKCTAITFDRTRGVCYVGLDSGKVQMISLTDATASFDDVFSYPAHTARVTVIEHCPERDIAVSAARDKKVCVFSPVTKDFVSTRVTDAWIDAMAYDPTGERCFVGTYSRSILIVSLKQASGDSSDTKAIPKPHVIAEMNNAHGGSVRSLFFASRKKFLFSGSFDKTVGIWDIRPADADGRSAVAVGRLSGHRDKVKAVVYAPEVQRVFSAGDDGRIIVWETKTGSAVSTTLAHSDKIIALRWIPARRWLVSASHDRKIKIFSFNEEDA